LVDVQVRRHHVVISSQHGRSAGRQELGRPLHETVEPAKLVVELRTRRGIPVREIEAANHQATYHGLEVSALRVIRITGQTAQPFDRVFPAGEDGYTVPALLAVPDCPIASATN